MTSDIGKGCRERSWSLTMSACNLMHRMHTQDTGVEEYIDYI